MKRIILISCAMAALTVAGCSDSGPTKPGGNYKPLAGGGRQRSDDPFSGGPQESGPLRPEMGPDSGIVPIFYSDRDCTKSPSHIVITGQADWEAWWKEANACLWRGGSMNSGHMGSRDSAWSDSGMMDTMPPCGRCETDPPTVDFDRNVVVAIRVEYDSGSWCMRHVWISDIRTSGQGSTIRYEISRLNESCCSMMMMPMLAMGTSPSIAVLAPRPLTEPIRWERTDTTYTCSWEPDPKEPLTVYFTDAPCDLGPGETVIADSAGFAAWIRTALTCDSTRWSRMWEKPGDSSAMPGDPGRPMPMMPWWNGFNVDFSSHAVIILRSGQQDRWGGGIWLDKIATDQSGTTISYTVMVPGDSCPPTMGMHMGDMPESVDPTVAIRVPLPLPAPLSWKRHVETIDCNWGADSMWVGIKPR